MNDDLTAEQLRSLLAYDPETGIFTRRFARRGARAGDVVGGLNWKGYVRITVAGTSYRAHRLAWLYMHGAWPSAQIDHADGDKTNNRIANLRDLTNAENHQNFVKAHHDSKSGIRGVSYDQRRKCWVASICVDYKKRALGRFDTAEEARQAYLAAKAELHPFAPEVA